MNAEKPANTFPWKFFVLVFLLSIPILVISAALGNKLPIPVNLPISALMFVVPAVAAAILVYREQGRDGLRGLFGRLLAFRQAGSIRWYILAFVLVPLIYLGAYLLMRVVGVKLPDPEIPWATIPVLFGMFFVSAACEESGWTGYAIDPIQHRLGAVKASLILGLVWQVWHIIPDIQAQNTATWILWHSLYSIALRLLMVWIYNNTGKNLLAAITVHTMDNVSWSLFPNYGSGYDPFFTWIVAGVVVVIVIVLWDARTLTRYRYAAGTR